MPNYLKIIPGELPVDYCFSNFQQLNLDILSIAQIVDLLGSRFYNLGNQPPDPDNRDFPWFNTNDSQWYSWNIDVGLWVRPHPVPPSSQSRILWVGDTTSLQSYDGGDANPAGDASGPMWTEDEDFRAKFPVGPGTMPSGTVIGVGGTGGVDQATIPVAAMPPHQHIVPFSASPSATSDPGTGEVFPGTVKYGIGFSFTNNGQLVENTTGGTRPRCYPLTSQFSTDPAPAVDQDPIDLLPPYRGVFFIKRTSRRFYVAP